MADKALFSSRRVTNRRDLLESLENRQLMAGFNANINFQPSTTATPSGFIADIGKTYSGQNGLTYGWNAKNASNARDRKSSADADHDTFQHFGTSESASKWEIAVPNGTYNVSLLAGDPYYHDSSYGFSVEGKTLLKGTPAVGKNYISATGAVTVSDGKLTPTSAAGSFNNKISDIKISSTSSSAGNATGASIVTPKSPLMISAYSNSVDSSNVRWTDQSTNESGFIIERSTDNKTWAEAGRVGSNVTTFNDAKLKANTKYYYRVKAYNAAGISSPTAVENASTIKSPSATKPGTVTNVNVAATSSTSATITWSDLGNETGYYVQRATKTKGTYVQVGQVGQNVTNYTDPTAKASTKYYYRIVAFNALGSTTGNAVLVNTPTTPTAPTVTTPKSTSISSIAVSGTDGAKLSWGDVTGETGYIVSKSTDGKTFTEATRVGANVSTTTIRGLSSNTTYSFRVSAYNSAGAATVSAIRTVKITVSIPTDGGGTSNGSMSALAGINLNGAPADASGLRNTLIDVGVKRVRLWYSSSWTSTSVSKWYADRAASYKAAGFTVMMAVMHTSPTDYNTAKRFYTMLANSSSLRNSVDYWQINNEPNIGKFYSGSLSQYVNTELKPASEALHAVGEKVVGAGPSWDVTVAQKLTALGYTKYVDYAAFHPYADSGQQVIQRAAAAKAAFNNMPIIFTEWCVSSKSDKTAWANENSLAASGLSKIGFQSYYFGLTVDNTIVGGAGIINSNGSRNTLFYNGMKDYLN